MFFHLRWSRSGFALDDLLGADIWLNILYSDIGVRWRDSI